MKRNKEKRIEQQRIAAEQLRIAAEQQRIARMNEYNSRREATKRMSMFHPGGYGGPRPNHFYCCGRRDNDRFNGCTARFEYTMPEWRG